MSLETKWPLLLRSEMFSKEEDLLEARHHCAFNMNRHLFVSVGRVVTENVKRDYYQKQTGEKEGGLEGDWELLRALKSLWCQFKNVEEYFWGLSHQRG